MSRGVVSFGDRDPVTHVAGSRVEPVRVYAAARSVPVVSVGVPVDISGITPPDAYGFGHGPFGHGPFGGN